MKKKYLNIILALLCFCSYSANSQINCTVPLAPVLTSVSVQPETYKTEFNWILSESTGIAAYIIYSYTSGDGIPIDTVWDPAATSHIITNTAPKYSSVSYVVAAHRLSAVPGLPGCTSPLSNVLSTIFSEANIDTCNKKIHISWNRYQSEPNKVTGYAIMVAVNGEDFSELAIVGSDTNNYTLDNFVTDAEYCFYIRANLEGGLYSTSNKSCLLTKMQRPPGWINADFATVSADNKIMLSFTIDPMSEITDFNLERKTGQSGTFEQIAKPGSFNGSVLFTDNQADVKVVNYYRLSAINSCNIPIISSNTASNMVLSLEWRASDLIFSWNNYTKWTGTVSSYRLFVDSGDGYEEKAVIDSADTIYTLAYKEIMYDVSGSEVCFYISASETGNPYGIAGQSNSSGICTSPAEIITVPNVFTPNADLVNDFFRPVLSFTPRDYHLIVSDQHGSVLFETRDYNASWDGSKNGKPQPQGVCIWFLKVTTPSGKSISKTGTVTVIIEV
jgi:gliding motility-associated-like protein